MSKKKIAVCISGQMRNLEYVYKKYVNPNLYECNLEYELYTFVHTWFQKDNIGKEYALTSNHPGNASDPIPCNILSKLYELYNPTKSLIEKQIDFKKMYPNMSGKWSPENRISKSYSVKQSCKLKNDFEKENNFTFDGVVFTRYDLGISKIDLNVFDFSNLVYNSSDVCPKVLDINYAIMSSETFNKFAGLYDYEANIVKTQSFLPPSECNARNMIDQMGIKIKYYSNLSQYYFIRKDYEQSSNGAMKFPRT